MGIKESIISLQFFFILLLVLVRICSVAKGKPSGMVSFIFVDFNCFFFFFPVALKHFYVLLFSINCIEDSILFLFVLFLCTANRFFREGTWFFLIWAFGIGSKCLIIWFGVFSFFSFFIDFFCFLFEFWTWQVVFASTRWKCESVIRICSFVTSGLGR